MMKDNSYAAIMARKNEIIRNSVGMDYESFEKPGIGFDYEAMMAATGYTLPELQLCSPFRRAKLSASSKVLKT